MAPQSASDRQPTEGLQVEPLGRKAAPLRASIDGVVLQRFEPFSDHRGDLAEVFHPGDELWQNDPIVWSYLITVRPDRIKGFGMHLLQDDRYAVLVGRLRVVLHDGRTESPTRGATQVVLFTESTPGLLRIPAGVWHADQNTGATDVVLMNFPTRAYDHADPDKFTIDPYSGEIPFDWSLPNG